MAKSFIIVMIALAVVSMADPFAEIKNIIKQDECQISKMEELKPKIEQQLQLLKENKNDFVAKTELISLVQQAKAIYNECELDNKVQPALGDVVEATGIAFLLASNCSKDVGIVFLLADSIIQDPKAWTNDAIVSIFLAVLGRQGYKDCSQFVNFIVG